MSVRHALKILIAVCLYLCLYPIAESQASPINVTVPDVGGTAGSQITVPINVSDTTDAGIVDADIILTFDSSILTAIDASVEDTIASGWMMFYDVDVSNQITIAMISLDGLSGALSGAGTLIKVNFGVSDGLYVGEKSPLTLSKVSFNSNSIPVNKINGEFTVIPSGQIGITVSRPNGGEKIRGGTPYSILWTHLRTHINIYRVVIALYLNLWINCTYKLDASGVAKIVS